MKYLVKIGKDLYHKDGGLTKNKSEATAVLDVNSVMDKYRHARCRLEQPKVDRVNASEQIGIYIQGKLEGRIDVNIAEWADGFLCHYEEVEVYDIKGVLRIDLEETLRPRHYVVQVGDRYVGWGWTSNFENARIFTELELAQASAETHNGTVRELKIV